MTDLTPKETTILRHVFAGLTNPEIVKATRFSLRTVELHRARAMKKLGVDSFALLMRRLCAEGWEADQQQSEKVA